MSMHHIKDGNSYDVVVIGGGPAGATVATLLTRGGLRVAVFEREHFPRFHVGESLLPANLPIFDHLGCHDAMRQAGFIVKPGASFMMSTRGEGPTPLHSGRPRFNQPLRIMSSGLLSMPCCCGTQRARGPSYIVSTR